VRHASSRQTDSCPSAAHGRRTAAPQLHAADRQTAAPQQHTAGSQLPHSSTRQAASCPWAAAAATSRRPLQGRWPPAAAGNWRQHGISLGATA
jgi:hypothetical protein